MINIRQLQYHVSQISKNKLIKLLDKSEEENMLLNSTGMLNNYI